MTFLKNAELAVFISFEAGKVSWKMEDAVSMFKSDFVNYVLELIGLWFLYISFFLNYQTVFEDRITSAFFVLGTIVFFFRNWKLASKAIKAILQETNDEVS